jgi:CTP synthase
MQDKNMDAWESMVRTAKNPGDGEVRIGMVGKYVKYEDSYKSLNEALAHGGIGNDLRVRLIWVEAEEIERGNPDALLGTMDGILVPGGFGMRGTAGMVEAVRYARERKVPFFGICLGMQIATIGYARNVCGLGEADSSEFQETTPHPVISSCATCSASITSAARCGWAPSVPARPDSLAYEAYGAREVKTHRHHTSSTRHAPIRWRSRAASPALSRSASSWRSSS